MTFPDLFRLYIWLVDVIRQSNGITLEEINKKWSRTGLCDGRPMSRSSFIGDIQQVPPAYSACKIGGDNTDGFFCGDGSDSSALRSDDICDC